MLQSRITTLPVPPVLSTESGYSRMHSNERIVPFERWKLSAMTLPRLEIKYPGIGLLSSYHYTTLKCNPLQGFDLAHTNNFAFQKLSLPQSRQPNQLLSEEFKDEKAEWVGEGALNQGTWQFELKMYFGIWYLIFPSQKPGEKSKAKGHSSCF